MDKAEVGEDYGRSPGVEALEALKEENRLDEIDLRENTPESMERLFARKRIRWRQMGLIP